jgi:hypothetical protein
MLKSAQWDLERVCRRIYGDDAPKDGDKERFSIVLDIGIDRSKNAVYGTEEKELPASCRA